MELNGKCRYTFDKWYGALYTKNLKILLDFKKPLSESLLNDDVRYGNKCLTDFMKLPFSMQYGVYVDFFDSVGVHIETTRSERFEGVWCYYFEFINRDYQDNFKTRQEAITEAIKKANEIFNNG